MNGEVKDSDVFILGSIVLMVVWLFLYQAFHVPAFVSATLLTIAFSLFCFDWWMHSRTQGTPGRFDTTK